MVSLQVAFAAMVLTAAGQGGPTVLLDFSATWCRPCQGMEPAVHELINKGYPVQKVDFDKNRALATRFGVTNIPCFVMIVDGREVDRVVGGTSVARLERMCKLGARSAAPESPTMIARGEPAKGGRSVATGDASWSAVAPAKTGPTIRPATGRDGTTADARVVPVAWTPRGGSVTEDDNPLVAATVRLRIEDRDGHSCGTGTIIDARKGEALILTCGHIFRDSQGKGRIEVDLFGSTPVSQVPGRLISFDLKRDVGLVSIRTPGPVVAARVAPRGYLPRRGEQVVSVGCNNGNTPTARASHVTAVDKFMGPPNSNLSVAGQPVEGRSGGGLFSSDLLVIGVCNAADPSDKEGLFAALGSIYAELDRAGLAYLFQPGTKAPTEQEAIALSPSRPQQTMPNAAPRERNDPPVAPMTDENPGMNPGERAALTEIQRRWKEGAEVVCIVRDRQDPRAQSDVIMIDKASAGFLQQLDRMTTQTRSPQTTHETSLEIPHPRKAILEWDAERGWLHHEPLPAGGR